MLTDTFIRTVKPAETPKKYADGGGLFLYVPPSGSKLWRLAYRFNKKSKLLSFGEYPTVSLKTARERREAAKKLLSENIDPSQHKKDVRNAMLAEEANTFSSIALEWHETQTVNNSEGDRLRKLYCLNTYIFPVLGKMPITSIEAQDILTIVKPLEKKASSHLAHQIVQYCGMVFRYAIASGKARHNIAADLRGALRSKQVTHRASITDAHRIGRLLLQFEEYRGYFPVRCALRLLPLFFVRSGELCNAEWQEFNFESREWRIPPHRMKKRHLHIVPLAEQAVTILKELWEYTGHGKYLFPSVRTLQKPICDSTLLAALRRMGYTKDDLCVHGIRSMASTLLNEMEYNRDWIERQLAHVENNQVRAAYNHAQYLPQRRRMMEEWAEYLDTLREKARQEGA